MEVNVITVSHLPVPHFEDPCAFAHLSRRIVILKEHDRFTDVIDRGNNGYPYIKSAIGEELVSMITHRPLVNATGDGKDDFNRDKQFYDLAQMVTGLILYPIICLPGLIGNALTVYVLSQSSMRTTTNVYLLWLAVSDSVKLLTDLLYPLVIILMKIDPVTGQYAYAYLYPYAHFFFNMTACVSSWLIVSVAVERYLLVCHAARAKWLCTLHRARVATACVVLCMALLAVPTALRYQTVDVVQQGSGGPSNVSVILSVDVNVTSLWQNETFATAYSWVQSLLRSIIPLVILVILNTCIINAARQTRANKKNTSRNKITVMLIVVIVVFLVCITPDAIMCVFRFGYHESDYHTKGVREFTDTLLALNAALNVVIYCAFNKAFRKTFLGRFCKGCQGGTIRSNTQFSETVVRGQELTPTVSCAVKSSCDVNRNTDARSTAKLQYVKINHLCNICGKKNWV